MTRTLSRRTGTLRLLAILVAASLRASLRPRRVFIAQATMMILNNTIMFVIWVLFFSAFESIGGWLLEDMALLIGIVATAHGLLFVLFGSLRHIAMRVNAGELDIYLTQPVPPLGQLVTQQSNPTGWGDMIMGIALLIWFADVGAASAPLIAVCTLASALVMAGSYIIINSFVFWARAWEIVAQRYFEFLITFATYPGSIYTGAIRFFLYTIVPAGFAGFMPVDMIRNPAAETLLILLAACGTYGALGLAIFKTGLARYTSGSQFSERVTN